VQRELDRQVESLLARRYPEAVGLSEADFLARVAPLRGKLPVDGGVAARTAPRHRHARP
jgi:hypothetical protein